MGPNRGNVSVVSVFRLSERLDEDSARSYYEAVEERNQALEAESGLVREAGARVDSHVLVSTTAFRGLVSAAETTRANLLLTGWPGHGPREAEEALADSLDRYLRTHLVLFREDGPVPAERILAVVDDGPHGELALLVASRLTAAWEADLTVASLVEAHADEARRMQAEADLEADLGVSVRARVRAVPASSPVQALQREVEMEGTQLLVMGVSGVGAKSLAHAIDELSPFRGASLALVRAYPRSSLNPGRRT